MKKRNPNKRRANIITVFSIIGGFFTLSLFLGIASNIYFTRGSKTNKAEIFETSAEQASNSIGVAIHSVEDYGKMFADNVANTYVSNEDVFTFYNDKVTEYTFHQAQIYLIDADGDTYGKDSTHGQFSDLTLLNDTTEQTMYVGTINRNSEELILGFIHKFDSDITASVDSNPIQLRYAFVGRLYSSFNHVSVVMNINTDSYLMNGAGDILTRNVKTQCPVNGRALFGFDEARNIFSPDDKQSFRNNIASNKNFVSRFWIDGEEFVASVNKYEDLDCWQVEIARLNDVSSATDKASVAVLLTTTFLCLLMMTAAIVLAIVIKRNRDNEKTLKKEAEINKYLEYASNAKTTFLFNMSHDIRTPMNAIIGFTDVAERHIDNKEKALDALSKVRSSSNHLLALINDVLDMSRIESGKVEIVVKPLNIVDALNDTSFMLQSFAEKKKVNYKFETKHIKHKNVKLDLLHVNQIIVNIVSNAVKYNHENGDVLFTVEEVESEILDFAKFKFVCKDTGIGMSQDFLAHVFETFSRDNNVRSTSAEGTGLGLSIAKSLVDVMNGDISVESELGKGTTFTVILPFEITESVQEREVLKPIEEIDLTNKHLLIVEDNELNREIAKDILEESGFIVDTAEDGDIGVELVKEKGIDYYDIILMDIQMPRMNGYEATKEIRRLFPDKHVPIIALSANAFEEDKQKSRDSGMDDHQSKPIVVPELMEAIRRLLTK